jgi:hypothetical protein
MDYENVIKITNYDYICLLPNNYVIQIKYINKSSTKCKLLLKNKLILEYNDTKVNDNIFIRKINNNKYTFEIGKLTLKETIKKNKFFKPLKKNDKNNFNFLTLDIETYLDKDNYQVPYCICIYDGKENKIFKFYLDEYNSSEEMLINAIKSISLRKYNNYNIYAHNFSNFDGILLLRILNKIGIINPTIKDGRIISVNFNYESNKSNKLYTLKFFDSILLLQNSLRKLAKSFNTYTQKGNFETLKVNENNYKEFKEEVINYCIDDCKSLYQILFKFNQLIYDNFNITIKNYPTIPSLSFAIYRSNFLDNKKKIPLIHGEMYKFIKQSYTGGSVDVYKPTLINDNNQNQNKNKKIFRYDVNSLYPFAMKNFAMPCGEPIYFEGDILLNNDLSNDYKNNGKPYGIFEVDIIAPNIKIPLLQTKIKINNGNRTISPTGN